jgi:hypothetical protein
LFCPACDRAGTGKKEQRGRRIKATLRQTLL